MALMDPGTSGQESEADPFEQHWAVLVVDQATRLRALADATQRWNSRRGPHAPLNDRDLQAVVELGTAYDVAAIEFVDRTHAAEELVGLAESLQAGAASALALHAARPVSGLAGDDLACREMHLAALAVVADRIDELKSFRDDTGEMEDASMADDLAAVRRKVFVLWARLLLADGPDELRALSTLIADVRESLNASADERSPRQLFGRATVSALADAAADLSTYLHHGEPIDVLTRVTAHLVAARTTASGAAALNAAVTWLSLAVARMAHRRDQQLWLPSVGRS